MNNLIHGNCIDELEKLPSNSVDLLCTDPPYGNNTAYYGRKRIAGDESPITACAAIAASYRVLRRNSAAYVFSDIKHLSFLSDFIRGYTPFAARETIIWNKCRFGMGRRFRRQHEIILVLEKGRPKYNLRNVANVLSIANPANKEHPHEKPIKLLRTLIAHSSESGDVVLDPFMGSGSTGVAAKQENRRFIGIECHAGYVELARSRILASTL